MPRITKQKPTTRSKSRSSSSVLDRIGPVELDNKIRINLYGKSATGKTTLWAGFPKPILGIICSGASAKSGEMRSISKKDRAGIEVIRLQSPSEIEELVKLQNTEAPFKTVVLDHATGLQDATLGEVLQLDKVPEQLSWGLATQQQYGQVAVQMKERLRSLLDLDCNVVIVAQEREFNTDIESDVIMPYVASALIPSVVGWLLPACDYICETFIRAKTEEKEIDVAGKPVKTQRRGEGVEYCLRTAPHDVYTTKFRLPKGTPLPDEIVDPTFEKLYKLIQGE